MLSRHSLQHSCPAILGHPLQQLQTDYKFQHSLAEHLHSGEMLAQAALQTELLVCKVAGVKYAKYIGRSQYPKIRCKPSRHKHCIDDKFISPAANFWGVLGHVLEDFVKLRCEVVILQIQLGEVLRQRGWCLGSQECRVADLKIQFGTPCLCRGLLFH